MTSIGIHQTQKVDPFTISAPKQIFNYGAAQDFSRATLGKIFFLSDFYREVNIFGDISVLECNWFSVELQKRELQLIPCGQLGRLAAVVLEHIFGFGYGIADDPLPVTVLHLESASQKKIN